MSQYEIRMEGVSEIIDAATHADAVEQAKKWIAEGDYDTDEGTVWVHGYLLELDRDDTAAECIEVTIEPPEPDCEDGREHDWQSPVELVGGIKENPGVWGHGGGVVIHEVCMHCGTERVTDTWAQDPDTGRQGLHSVAYHAGKYAADVRAEEEED